jgi:CRP-like cAMP-binding protein
VKLFILKNEMHRLYFIRQSIYIQKMKAFLQKFDILTDQDIDQLEKLTTTKTFQKSEYFISEGDVCNSVAFLKSGIFRSFHLSHSGEALTYCIIFPNNFLTAYSSFITGKNTQENIQAITHSELILIPKNEITKLAATNPRWLLFLKVMAEQQYIELENRIFQFQKESAKQRYMDLLKNQPEMIQQIPLQYLASYLGITQRHLSRLRKAVY